MTERPDESADEAERPDESADDARRRAARKRRLAEVFGEVLPSGDPDTAAAEQGDDEASRERDLKRNVPPHHVR